MYWLVNSVLGLYIIDQFGSYLDNAGFKEVSECILMFSLKMVTSIALALSLIIIISIGSAVECFTGDLREIKASIKAMAIPLYLLCLILQ